MSIVFSRMTTTNVLADIDWLGLFLDGTESADTIRGTGGSDRIQGFGGNDRLFGGGGNDQIFGGTGNDLMDGGTGADHLNGGTGNDTVSYAAALAGVIVDLALGGTGGEAAGDTFVSVEKVVGSRHGDILTGDNASNTLSGGDGNDTLAGGGGTDFLFGGANNDRLEGGAGVDFVYGGTGRDTFVLNLPGDGSVDVIADFVSGEDVLQVSQLGATFHSGYFTRLSFSQGTELPDTVTFARSTTYGGGYGGYGGYGEYANHLFFDTDDGQLYVLDPIVSGYGRYQHVTGFETIRVAAIEGTDHLTIAGFGAFLA